MVLSPPNYLTSTASVEPLLARRARSRCYSLRTYERGGKRFVSPTWKGVDVNIELGDEERQMLLISLWNYQLMTQNLNAEHASVESLETIFQYVERSRALASKLGGDGSKPLYGIGIPTG